MSPSESARERVLAGRYRLHEPVGRGGMGTVWRAEDTLLGREVAIKEVLLPDGLDPAERDTLSQRTMREARTAARISHPAVVTVFDVVEQEGRPWIVMELVHGRPLDAIVNQEGPLQPRHVAEIGRLVLDALTVAHAVGVVHRDVKPSNVLITGPGRVVLTDFGIATAEGDPSLTQSGILVGSPAYLAPERARGGAATPACDLWALGATMFYAVEGHAPFQREGAMATLGAVLTEQPPRPAHAGALAPAIMALLAPDPAERIAAPQARDLLDRAVAGTPTPVHGSASDGSATSVLDAVPEPEPLPVAPIRRGRGWLTALIAVVAVLALAAAGGLWWRYGHKEASRTSASHSSHGATHRPPSHSPTPTPPPSVPAGYTMQHDPAGFSIALPPGWGARQVNGNGVTYSSPDKRAYLLVDQTQQPTQDPMHNMRLYQAAAINKDHKFPGAHTLRLAPTSYLGRRAADWEFTWQYGNGTIVHTIDRQFVTTSGHFFAIYWQAPDSDWAADAQARNTAFATFRPA